MRTIDELSELEEFIEQACRESTRELQPPAVGLHCWCPLYAVSAKWSSIIGTSSGARVLGLTEEEMIAFYRGFDREDGSHRRPPEPIAVDREPDLFAMGRRFRERAIAREYAR